MVSILSTAKALTFRRLTKTASAPSRRCAVFTSLSHLRHTSATRRAHPFIIHESSDCRQDKASAARRRRRDWKPVKDKGGYFVSRFLEQAHKLAVNSHHAQQPASFRMCCDTCRACSCGQDGGQPCTAAAWSCFFPPTTQMRGRPGH